MHRTNHNLWSLCRSNSSGTMRPHYGYVTRPLVADYRALDARKSCCCNCWSVQRTAVWLDMISRCQLSVSDGWWQHGGDWRSIFGGQRLHDAVVSSANTEDFTLPSSTTTLLLLETKMFYFKVFPRTFRF